MIAAATRLDRMPGEPADRLIDRYVAGDPLIAPFFGPALASLDSTPHAARAGSLLDAAGRRALTTALRAQPGAASGAADQRHAIAALEERDTLAVVTGQQPGLFLGPLLTLYKAVSAVALARRLAARLARPVVPVFWIASEDDDLSEIDSLTIPGAGGGLDVVQLFADGSSPERRPYASLRLEREFDRARAETVARLPDSETARRLADRLAAAAREASPVAAFARLLGDLLGPSGLVVADPADPALKTLLAPVFRREAESPLATSAGAQAAASRLSALGVAAQVRPESNHPAFFVLEEGRRARPDPSAALRLAERPDLLVPNVLLRPVCQDFLFPTAATICGPSEIAYLAQTGEAYGRHGVPRPVAVPRLSALLVEPDVARFLDRQPGDLALLRRAPSTLAAPAGARPELAEIERPAADLDAALGRLEERLARESPPLSAMVSGARRKIAFESERVLERTRKDLDRGAEESRKRAARAREKLFPDGRLQERVLSPLPFLARWETLPEALADLYDPLDARPLLVRLAASGGERPRVQEESA